jgi:hypothetical protein
MHRSVLRWRDGRAGELQDVATVDSGVHGSPVAAVNNRGFPSRVDSCLPAGIRVIYRPGDSLVRAA